MYALDTRDNEFAAKNRAFAVTKYRIFVSKKDCGIFRMIIIAAMMISRLRIDIGVTDLDCKTEEKSEPYVKEPNAKIKDKRNTRR